MKIKKQNLYIYLSIISITVLLLLSLHSTFEKPIITCETEVIAEKHNSNGKLISIHTKILYSISPVGNGSIRFKGFITDAEGKRHHLNRRQYFNYLKKSNGSIYQTTVIKEQKYPEDDTNDNVFSFFFNTIGMNINETRKIEKVSDEVLMFSDLLTPSMICLIIK